MARSSERDQNSELGNRQVERKEGNCDYADAKAGRLFADAETALTQVLQQLAASSDAANEATQALKSDMQAHKERLQAVESSTQSLDARVASLEQSQQLLSSQLNQLQQSVDELYHSFSAIPKRRRETIQSSELQCYQCNSSLGPSGATTSTSQIQPSSTSGKEDDESQEFPMHRKGSASTDWDDEEAWTDTAHEEETQRHVTVKDPGKDARNSTETEDEDEMFTNEEIQRLRSLFEAEIYAALQPLEEQLSVEIRRLEGSVNEVASEAQALKQQVQASARADDVTTLKVDVDAMERKARMAESSSTKALGKVENELEERLAKAEQVAHQVEELDLNGRLDVAERHINEVSDFAQTQQRKLAQLYTRVETLEQSDTLEYAKADAAKAKEVAALARNEANAKAPREDLQNLRERTEQLESSTEDVRHKLKNKADGALRNRVRALESKSSFRDDHQGKTNGDGLKAPTEVQHDPSQPSAVVVDGIYGSMSYAVVQARRRKASAYSGPYAERGTLQSSNEQPGSPQPEPGQLSSLPRSRPSSAAGIYARDARESSRAGTVGQYKWDLNQKMARPTYPASDDADIGGQTATPPSFPPIQPL